MAKLFMVLLLNIWVPLAFSADHIMHNPQGLTWTTGPKSLPPGSQIMVLEGDPAKAGPFTVRLKFPANYKIQPHWHPAIEHVTVMEGQFYMGPGDKYEEKNAQALNTGGFAVMPIKFNHFAFTKEKPATVQLHGIGPWDIIYLDPANDPRKTK